MTKITNIDAYQILDSRGKPTLEVKVTTDDGMMAMDSVPSGTSTGSFESIALEPKRAVENINNIIKPKVIGLDPTEQVKIDELMIKLDSTPNKSSLGANAILGVSLAVARVAAMSQKKPLYRYLNGLFSRITGIKVEPTIPLPIMVMFEGGEHGKESNLCIQEFSCITTLEKGRLIWKQLKEILVKNKMATNLGLEGGFIPDLEYDEDAIRFIMEAVKTLNLQIPDDVQIALDVAANHCEITVEDILSLVDRYPIYGFEDPVSEEDWDNWSKLYKGMKEKGKDFLLIGDDLFVTNEERLKKGINNEAANGVIIKVNQVGTLTETMNVIAKAYQAKFTHILSHRSGETMDTFISDLAVATGAKYLKSGAPFASERVIKYNRLEEIRQEL